MFCIDVFNEYLQKTIRQLFPTFNNHDMHDAQEFLLTLLTGLSDDLNRVCQAFIAAIAQSMMSLGCAQVKYRAPLASQNYAGQTYEEAATANLRNHMAVEDSIVTDVFFVSPLIACHSAT